MKSIIILILSFIGCLNQAFSQDSFLLRQTTSACGGSYEFSAQNQTFLVQQSIGQASAIGTFNQESYTLNQGFLQTDQKNVTTSTSSNLDVKVCPNPFNDQLKVQFNEIFDGQVHILLVDLTGKVVFDSEYSATNGGQIEINNLILPAGSYFIQIFSNGKSHTSKLFKS